MGFNSGFKGLIYFIIELFGRVVAYAATRPNSSIMKYINWYQ